MESQLSGYSSFGDQSVYGPAAPLPPTDDSWSVFPALLCLLLLGGTVIFFFVMAGAIGASGDDDVAADIGSGGGGDGGGGGGGGGGAPLPVPIVGPAGPRGTKPGPDDTSPPGAGPIEPPPFDTPGPVIVEPPTPPPAEPPAEPPVQPPEPPAPVETTTTEAPVPLRKELICTVGNLATENKMYPRDGLCHYLYYTHVFVYVNATIVNIQSTTINSFGVFQRVIGRYKKTEGGLSFDIRSMNRTYAKRAKLDLSKLAKKRIVHYGFLNVIERPDKLKDIVSRAIEIMKELKKVQKNDPAKRTVVAIGGINYASSGAWKLFKDAVIQAADKGTGIDTVITITSFSYWLEDMNECKTVPPGIINGPDTNYPSLYRHMELVNEANQGMYGNKYAVVGLSFVMGAMLYTYNKDQSDALNLQFLYTPCESTRLMPLDVGCGTDPKAKVRDINIGYAPEGKGGGKKVLLIYDDSVTQAEKIKYILSKKPRRRFAVLYFDLNMADFRSVCGFRNPFQMIQTLKKNFSIADKPEQP